jgi:hypothetical protein
MNKYLSVSLLFLLLLMPLSSAFEYKVEQISNIIDDEDPAAFKLTVTNTLLEDDTFTISTRDLNWVLTSTPPIASAGPGESVDFLIELSPKPSQKEGNVYVVPIKINSEASQSFQEEGRRFTVFLGPRPNYNVNIIPTLIMDKVVDPREPVSVRINLRNRNQRDIPELEVRLTDGEQIDRSYITSLIPMEEKVNEILFRIEPTSSPGKKTLNINLIFENTTVGHSSSEYEVLAYTDMQEKSSKESSLFRKMTSFEITNKGNERGVAEHAFQMSFFNRIFTRFEPDVTRERAEDGSIHYVVRKEINPGETFAFSAVTDYRLLVSIITLAILAVILYFLFRSPVIIYKNSEAIGKATHEGLSEVKVRLYLKNRSSKQVSNIRVTDVIPTIAELKKSTHVGSMDPVNVAKGKKGTIARWEFASLEPYEERVIAYKIESKLKLVGGIRLPSAKVRFETKKGKERVSYSNHVNLIHVFEEKQEPIEKLEKKKA